MVEVFTKSARLFIQMRLDELFSKNNDNSNASSFDSSRVDEIYFRLAAAAL